jgi:hypothetical protein
MVVINDRGNPHGLYENSVITTSMTVNLLGSHSINKIIHTFRGFHAPMDKKLTTEFDTILKQHSS